MSDRILSLEEALQIGADAVEAELAQLRAMRDRARRIAAHDPRPEVAGAAMKILGSATPGHLPL